MVYLYYIIGALLESIKSPCVSRTFSLKDLLLTGFRGVFRRLLGFLSDLYGFLAIQTQMPLPGRLDCSGLPGHHLLTDLVRLSNQHPFARFSALNLDAQERQDGGGLHS